MIHRLRTEEPTRGSILDGENAGLRQHVAWVVPSSAMRADGEHGQRSHRNRSAGRCREDDSVATLAVLADDAAARQGRACARSPVHERRRVGRVIENRDGCYPDMPPSIATWRRAPHIFQGHVMTPTR